ncbi:MAG: FAD-dependent oxidoreductase [Clostridiales bacterium]|jgi:thioredoxin reductase (NADPH)|nr:FAD-dependent oxidoreductase [Clostridiales bacterium]
MLYDVIIIGGGPAGMAAAIYSKRAGLKTLLIESYVLGGQMLKAARVENYPGADVQSGYEIAVKIMRRLEELGAEILYDEFVSLSVGDDGKKLVTTVRNGTFSAKSVILCMGAAPKKLKIKGEDEFLGRGVSYCAVCDGGFYKNKTVIVAGDGNIAVEDALYLSSLNNKVVIVARKDALNASEILKQKALGDPNISVVYNAVIREINGSKRLEGVTVFSGGQSRTIAADALFIAAGNTPAVDALKDGGKNKRLQRDQKGYLVTDDGMRTKIDGVFAAGDIRKKPLRQIVTACADGAISAEEAAKYIRSAAFE